MIKIDKTNRNINFILFIFRLFLISFGLRTLSEEKICGENDFKNILDSF